MKKSVLIILALAAIMFASCNKVNNPPTFEFYYLNELLSDTLNVKINYEMDIKIIAKGPNPDKQNRPFMGCVTYTLTKPNGDILVLYNGETLNRDYFRFIEQSNGENGEAEITMLTYAFRQSECNIGDEFKLNVAYDNWEEPIRQSLVMKIVEQNLDE
ncbi:MAG: hypothetical protein HUK15_05345 [Bacteroidales bacterium]|nr:hypothetical protein [Bacteroidales bacterium]